jgi:hypothetical protein
MLESSHWNLSPHEIRARTTAHANVIVMLKSKVVETLPFLHIHVASLSEGLDEADNVSETPDLSQPQLPTLVFADQ